MVKIAFVNHPFTFAGDFVGVRDSDRVLAIAGGDDWNRFIRGTLRRDLYRAEALWDE